MFKRKIEKEEINAPKTATKGIKNTIALKRNVYAVVLSVIFIIAVLLINVFSTVMAVRYPLDIDLTSDKKHSMSDENIDFIRSVEKPVTIYVCLTKEQYECAESDNMAQLAAEQYFVDYNSANMQYFVQSAELLEKLGNYNDNIEIKYLDMNEAESALIVTQFDDYEYKKGDILVECPTGVNEKGETTYRRTAVLFEDIYTLEGNSYTEYYMQYAAIYGNMALYGQGAGYMITENKMEMAVSSAIYKVISDNTPKYLVPTTYYTANANGTIIVDEYLKNLLKINNYDLDYAEGTIAKILSEDKFDKYEGIILAGCNMDISDADYETILKFLDNNGNKGKSFVYFAGLDVAKKMPRLCAFLGEWGIGYLDGVVYEGSKDNRVMTDEKGDPKDFYHVSTGTDYTLRADTKGYYVVGNTVPMKSLWSKNITANHERYVDVLVRTGGYGTTTIMPTSEDSTTWQPTKDAKYDAYPTVIMSREEKALEDLSLVSSYVVAFATTEFINSDWVTEWTNVANDHLTLDVFNAVSGAAENPFNFVPKTITEEKFYPDEKAQLTVKIIFMAIIPVVVMVSGVTIWIVRKRK